MKRLLFCIAITLGLLPSMALAASYNPSSLTVPPAVTLSSPYPSLFIVTPQMYGAKCDGVTDDSTAISNMDSAGVGQETFDSGTCHISNSVTFAHPVAFINRSILDIASTKSATFSSCWTAASNQQIFSGSGTVIPSSTVSCPAIYPEWWGAKPDNSTVDTAPINSADTFCDLLTGGGRIVFQNGIYLTAGGHTLVVGTSPLNICSWEGQGKWATIINHNANNTLLTVTRGSSLIYAQAIMKNLQVESSASGTPTSEIGLKLQDATGYGLEDVVFNGFCYGTDVVLNNVNGFTEGFYTNNTQHLGSGLAYNLTRANVSPATSSFYGINLQNDYMSQCNSGTRGGEVQFFNMGQDGFAKVAYGTKINARINPGAGGDNVVFNIDGAGAASTNNVLTGTFDIKQDGPATVNSNNDILFNLHDRTGSSLGKGVVYATSVDFDPNQSNPGYLLDLSAGTSPPSVPTWSNQIVTGSNSLTLDSFGIPQAVLPGVCLKVYGTQGASVGSYTWGSGYLPQNSFFELDIRGTAGTGGTPTLAIYDIQTRGTANSAVVTLRTGTGPLPTNITSVAAVAGSPRISIVLDNSATASVSTFNWRLCELRN